MSLKKCHNVTMPALQAFSRDTPPSRHRHTVTPTVTACDAQTPNSSTPLMAAPPQTFEAHHQQLRAAALRDPSLLHLLTHARACWYRRAGNDWVIGIAQCWDCQADYTGTIVETAEGEVLSLSIDRVRFQPPEVQPELS